MHSNSMNTIPMRTILVYFFVLSLFSGANIHSQSRSMENVALQRAENNQDKPTVYFGFISRYNPRIMFQEYQPIMDYLTRETPYTFELKLGKTYEDAVRFLGYGEVQIASLGAVTYIEAHSRFGAVPILRPLNSEGEAHYHSLIIVREDSPLQSIKDLKGHSVAFASKHSTSGNLIPRYELARAGLKIDELSHTVNLKHHDSVARAILAGKYDAGAVKDIIGYKYLAKGLRILHKSRPIPSVPLVVLSDCDSTIIKAVKTALLKIAPRDSTMQAMCENWNAEFRNGFVETTDHDYLLIRQLLNQIPQRCGEGCHPSIKFK